MKTFYRLKVDAMGFGSLDDFLVECGGSVDKEDLWAFPAILARIAWYVKSFLKKLNSAFCGKRRNYEKADQSGN